MATNTNTENNIVQSGIANVQKSATVAANRVQTNTTDWRVRLSLAPSSQYLYNAPSPGILEPLRNTNGVLFPYTPQISSTYRANYTSYDLTHSNYKGYFYQNSYVEGVSLSCTFTAQDTFEATYLLAVIHFFRSVTKMFYGQDTQFRGSPPPIVYLSGLGDYQFGAASSGSPSGQSCVVSSFAYNLPKDVDYIRANSSLQNGVNLQYQKQSQTSTTQNYSSSSQRLDSSGLSSGAMLSIPAPPTTSISNPTYVPTKMEVQVELLPMQSRAQISQQFSLQNFANGNLLKGGFW